jgi:hypothetical protein
MFLFPPFGLELINKCPPSLLLFSLSFRYPSSEWMLSIISLAEYQIDAPGWEAAYLRSCRSLRLVSSVAMACWEARALIAVNVVGSRTRS